MHFQDRPNRMWYEMADSHFSFPNYFVESISYRDAWRRERLPEGGIEAAARELGINAAMLLTRQLYRWLKINLVLHA